MGRWAAIDYGRRRIGLAIADPAGIIASPAGSLRGSGSACKDAAAILQWLANAKVSGVVVGLPLNMDGSDSPQTARARRLADELRRLSSLPVELWDERLSSLQADRHLKDAGTRAGRRKRLRDALAAQVILQSFLAARRGAEPAEGQAGPED